MAKIFKNVDKIITSSGTEVDLDNIQATGGGGTTGLEGSGIAYSTDGNDEFYDAGSSSEVIALDIDNPQGGDGLIYDAASQTWKNGEISYGPSATGGTETDYTDADGVEWKVHTFTSTANLDVTSSGDIEYVVVAGGGGGGGHAGGGGGGAGGFISCCESDDDPNYSIYTATSIPRGTHLITVGAGGSGGSTANAGYSSGLPSSIGSIVTALGGGFGAWSRPFWWSRRKSLFWWRWWRCWR